ncbi:hypothetical protein F53441_9797 [Fusarium austroafricanum]|uniref:Uncharacterized protein n=1 Tax=Fusarium austroafricanum TaxID=2364996 RepID=A0A8H4KAA0_9HYPO|nr:hypothetical protein F53441_9797 [Fusarium austroafricanum]
MENQRFVFPVQQEMPEQMVVRHQSATTAPKKRTATEMEDTEDEAVQLAEPKPAKKKPKPRAKTVSKLKAKKPLQGSPKREQSEPPNLEHPVSMHDSLNTLKVVTQPATRFHNRGWLIQVEGNRIFLPYDKMPHDYPLSEQPPPVQFQSFGTAMPMAQDVPFFGHPLGYDQPLIPTSNPNVLHHQALSTEYMGMPHQQTFWVPEPFWVLEWLWEWQSRLVIGIDEGTGLVSVIGTTAQIDD